jgi:hypothetical protein
MALAAGVKQQRNQLLDTTRTLVHVGARTPGSLGEAQAAALLNGSLRNAGMRVATEPFRVRFPRRHAAALIGLLAAICAVGYGSLPLLATAGLLLLLLAEGATHTPWAARRHESQNVVATRAAGEARCWRLILLAPLDAPQELGAYAQAVAGSGTHTAVLRVLALVALVACGLLGLRDLHAVWWSCMALPAAYLALQAPGLYLRVHANTSPGAISYAASAALALAATRQLHDLRHVELWTVALGAATASDACLRDLFARYPFEREQTLLLNIEGVGLGQPTCITREGVWGLAHADATLLQLAAAADRSDPAINIEPRRYTAAPTVITNALRRGWRGLTIATLSNNGRVPLRHQADDLPEHIDEQVLDRALRLVVGIARQLDATF